MDSSHLIDASICNRCSRWQPSLRPASSAARCPQHEDTAASGDIRTLQRDRLDGEEERTRRFSPVVQLVIVCRHPSICSAKSWFPAPESPSDPSRYLSGCLSGDVLEDFSSSTAAGAPARQAGFPMVHFASLRDSALNTPNKPRLTENSDQKNDMGTTQRRQPAKSQWLATWDK